jgi:hypothetical protein
MATTSSFAVVIGILSYLTPVRTDGNERASFVVSALPAADSTRRGGIYFFKHSLVPETTEGCLGKYGFMGPPAERIGMFTGLLDSKEGFNQNARFR